MKQDDFDGLRQGLAEAAAHARGENVPGARVHYRVRNGADLRAARATLGLSPLQLADALRLQGTREAVRKRVFDMERGEREIPGPTAVAVEAMLAGFKPETVD